jgi:hypothetical protein
MVSVTEPEKNMNSDLKSFIKLMLSIKELTQTQTILSQLVITNSLLGPEMNTRDFSETKFQKIMSMKISLNFLQLILLIQLIGENKVLSMVLKTKANVVHAGLSLLLLLLKDMLSSKVDTFSVFLNNNLLIVTKFLMVVTVVSKDLLSTMMKLILKLLKKTIHTKESMELARTPQSKAVSKFQLMQPFHHKILTN